MEAFRERFPLRRRREVEREGEDSGEGEAEKLGKEGEEFMAPFGPEWELKEAMRELDSILESK